MGIYWAREFWIYEDFGKKHAKIHTEDCSHCKGGKGKGWASARSGRWLGPFSSRAIAVKVAGCLGLKYGESDCYYCGL